MNTSSNIDIRINNNSISTIISIYDDDGGYDGDDTGIGVVAAVDSVGVAANGVDIDADAYVDPDAGVCDDNDDDEDDGVNPDDGLL